MKFYFSPSLHSIFKHTHTDTYKLIQHPGTRWKKTNPSFILVLCQQIEINRKEFLSCYDKVPQSLSPSLSLSLPLSVCFLSPLLPTRSWDWRLLLEKVPEQHFSAQSSKTVTVPVTRAWHRKSMEKGSKMFLQIYPESEVLGGPTAPAGVLPFRLFRHSTFRLRLKMMGRLSASWCQRSIRDGLSLTGDVLMDTGVV